MAQLGVSVLVDVPMWRDLGDHYLRELGIQPLDKSAAVRVLIFSACNRAGRGKVGTFFKLLYVPGVLVFGGTLSRE